MKSRLKIAAWLFSFVVAAPMMGQAQAPKKPNAADIRLALEKLNVVGSVLYFAAHPDDENTRLIAYFANERKLRTGYLSLTRGDGGQNLIGPEIREELGLIRTQELLQARRTDGGEQFFSRANDFGFSKNPDETFTIWNREQVLADAVWTIRKFRPDVIVTRFSPVPGGTHGHHTASAIIAVEAFEAAADPKRFPEQLQYVQVWQPKRIFWNTSSFFFSQNQQFDTKNLLTIDAGVFNPLLGKSYNEIAADSRSMHKSQGFGSSGTRGDATEYFELLKGSPVKTDLLEGVNTTWSRVKGGEAVSKLIQQALKTYNPDQPGASVPALLKVKAAMDKLPESPWKTVKQAELAQVIKSCLGLYLETTAQEFSAIPGQGINLTLEATNRSSVPVTLTKLEYPFAQQDSSLQQKLEANKPLMVKARLPLPAQIPYSQPYWLRQPGTIGMYTVEDPLMIGFPESPSPAQVQVSLTVKGQPFTYTLPVVYKRTDPVQGEQYRPFVVTPPVFVNMLEKVYVFADEQPKPVTVRVRAGQAKQSGQVALQLPAGWRSEPASANFTLNLKDEAQDFTFQVFPSKNQTESTISAVATVGGQSYKQGLKTIEYAHIPTQTLFPVAEAKAVKLDLKRKGQRIGYLMGAGDEVWVSLQQIGYEVDMLKIDDLQAEQLKKYDAIVLGVRAYNTVERLKFQQPQLMEYVKNGGTLVVQYNVSNNSLVTNQIGPYPLELSADRVTVEGAEVRFLKPNHPVLNSPNKITETDFKGWVQERGIYFPNQWAPEYEAILSSNDPGETPKDSGLLVAKYGKGYYVYTGYVFFRELPAGVPGAYRLFVNILSLGK